MRVILQNQYQIQQLIQGFNLFNQAIQQERAIKAVHTTSCTYYRVRSESASTGGEKC